MFEVTIPAGMFSWLIDPITKFLFFDSYNASHIAYSKRLATRRKFKDLGSLFEYDIHLECDHISNSTVPMSVLLIKNKSDLKFSRVEILVEACAGYAKYQDFTTLIDVTDVPLIILLPRIPLKEMHFTDDFRIVTPYQHAVIKLNILDDNVSSVQSEAMSQYIYPSYTEFLNSHWDRKWEQVWNLDFIEGKKEDLRVTWKYYLVTRTMFPITEESTSIFVNTLNKILAYVGVPIFKLMDRRWIVNTLFWTPIFLRLRRLTQDD